MIDNKKIYHNDVDEMRIANNINKVILNLII